MGIHMNQVTEGGHGGSLAARAKAQKAVCDGRRFFGSDGRQGPTSYIWRNRWR